MTPNERDLRIEQLFDLALEEKPEDVEAFLKRECGDDRMFEEVMSLVSQLRTTESESLPTGTLIGKFQVSCQLGQGGFGRVYLALDSALGRNVAIKELDPRQLNAQSAKDRLRFVQRFHQEARTLAALDHKNIVKIYDVIDAKGTSVRNAGEARYLVMEYLEGSTLQQLIAEKTVPLAQKVEIMLEVAEALEYAHGRSVFHRDINPKNIMRLADGHVKVFDFGIARTSGTDSANLTGTGLVIGTVSYMAPEQLMGLPASALTDMFAYGVTFYELLTGVNPFAAADKLSIIRNILELRVSPIQGCTEALDRMIEKALEKDPNNRYGTMSDVITVVKSILSGLSPVRSGHRWPSARVLGLSMAAAVLLSLFAAGIFLWHTPGKRPGVAQDVPTTEPSTINTVVPLKRTPGSVETQPEHKTDGANPSESPPNVGESPPIRPSSPHSQNEVPVAPTTPKPKPPQTEGTSNVRPTNNTLAVTLAPPDERRPAPQESKVDPPVAPVHTVETPGLTPGRALESGREEVPRITDNRPNPSIAAAPVEGLKSSEPPLHPVELKPGTNRENPKDQLTYVWVPSGTYQMGCVPNDNQCALDEEPQHPVKITKGFWMTRTEVTTGAYERFTSQTGHSRPGGTKFDPRLVGDLPVTKVTWSDARDYCDWVEGRLPTEAEWEYAARGGQNNLRYPWGNDFDAKEANWFKTNPTGPRTLPVRKVGSGNGFDLFGMVGNAREWTRDFYRSVSYSATGPFIDPDESQEGKDRLDKEKVVRGGSFNYAEKDLRLSKREHWNPSKQDNQTGFRCVLPGLESR